MKKRPIFSCFEELVKNSPSRPCIISPSRKITAAEISQISLEVIDVIISKINNLGSIVGISAPNGSGFFALLLSVFRLGKTALLLDPGIPVFERKRISKKLGVKYTLIFPTPWPAGGGILEIEKISENPRRKIIDSSIVKLTSGTTGEPRGIIFTNEALLADENALTKVMGIKKEDVLVGAIPFNHSYGFSSLILPALLRGNTIAIPDGNGPFDVLRSAKLANATIFPTTPAYLEAMVNISGRINFPPSLRMVISAGAPLPRKAASAFRKKFSLPVHVFYGASECGGICFDREGGAAERGTVGEPIPGVKINIEGTNISPGEVGGKIIVQSPALGESYFPKSSPILRNGQFRTSDLGAWEGTELKLLGRLDEILNVKGRKIHPKEIEEVLLLHPLVEDVKVFGIPGVGKKEKSIQAVIACQHGILSKEEIFNWCKQRLQAAKIPRSIRFIPSLPPTRKGKVDKKKLVNFQE